MSGAATPAPSIPASSNDLLADRRFAWAMALGAEGDAPAAADLLAEVVGIAPLWAPGWAALGDARHRLADTQAALAAWRRALALDPGDRLGVGLKAALAEGRTPRAMPAAYVAALFDDYAPRFERHLVETLRYRGPDVLAAALRRAALGQDFARALDLGCGTGLMARALTGSVARIDGVDLSPAMAARAKASGLYADVSVCSIAEVFGRTPERHYDLVTAADVLVYVGDLGPVFDGAFRALSPGGILAFTLQTALAPEPDPPPCLLGADLRFAHGRPHVAASLVASGFAIESLEQVSSRVENGVPVPGLAAIARRPWIE